MKKLKKIAISLWITQALFSAFTAFISMFVVDPNPYCFYWFLVNFVTSVFMASYHLLDDN